MTGFGICDHRFGGGTVCIHCGGDVFDMLKIAESKLQSIELDAEQAIDRLKQIQRKVRP